METTLDVRGVTRRYGTREVLKGITFAAQKGEIIALLGRNGTGKSTLMNTITGYLCQSGGDISVCGYDVLTQPLEARRRTGYLPEQPPLHFSVPASSAGPAGTGSLEYIARQRLLCICPPSLRPPAAS